MSATLTIAIPTYNRCETLNNVLSCLVNDPDFDPNKIEVVVSDDASPDATSEIVARYPMVRYHRNEKNLKFGNHTVAMKMARGKYIKLLNDTAIFRPGALKKMVAIIEQADKEGVNLFFANPLISLKEGVLMVNNSVEFIDVVSFYVTWSVNTGLWSADFDQFPYPDRFVKTDMHQVDWMLTVCEMGRKTMVVVDDFFEISDIKNKVFSYNFFDVFINKYLEILRFHKIKGWAMEKEKFRLLHYFVLPWYFTLKKNKNYVFNTTNQHKIILKEYWCALYLIPLYLFRLIRH